VPCGKTYAENSLPAFFHDEKTGKLFFGQS